MADTTLAFVTYEGANLPGDPSVRQLIRRRAMKHTAAIRKKAGGYGRHNVRQSPAWCVESKPKDDDWDVLVKRESPDALPYVFEDEEAPRLEVARTTKVSATTATYWTGRPSPPLESALLASISKTYTILNLASPLTVLHLGISTLSYFASTSGGLGMTLSNMPESLGAQRLLSFIPSRYGRVPSITYATDCLVARLKRLLETGSASSAAGDMAALKPYTKALRSLQEAIDDEDMRMTPETLCAAELLGLFEV